MAYQDPYVDDQSLYQPFTPNTAGLSNIHLGGSATPLPPGMIDPSTGRVVTTPLPGARDYPGQSGAPAAPPTGGNFRDPAYAAQYVAYWASQPGVDPTLKSDPTYWIGKLTSGEFGTDENYILSKFRATGPGGTAGGAGTFDASGIDRGYLEPFTGQFNEPAGPPTYTPPPDFEGFDPFAAPTASDLYADPSYTTRRDEGAQAFMNNRSAAGTAHTGGTLKDFLKYNSQFASNEYGNVFDRKFNVWDKTQQGKLATYNTRYGVGTDTRDYFAKQSQQNRNNAWSTFLDTKDSFYRNQNEPFQKILSLADLGTRASAA